MLVLGGVLYPYATGGVAMQTLSLVSSISKFDVDISLWGSAPRGFESRVLVKQYPKNVRIFAVPTIGEPYGFLDTLLSHFALARKIVHSRFDAVHIMVWPSSRARLILLFARVRIKRSVFLIPDILPYEASSYSPNFLRRVATWLNWGIFLTSIRDLDVILCPSKYISDSLLKFGIEPGKLRILPIGIDLEPLKQVENVRNLGTPYILCFGPFLPKKGQHRLIEAFSRSRAKSDTKLVLVGSGTYNKKSSDYRVRCIDMANRLGVRERTLFFPQLQYSELVAMIRGSLLCAVPSDYEGLSRTTLEAMACGKPVIVTRNGGPREYVVDGENAFLVDPTDIEAFSSLIDKIVYDPGLRAKIEPKAIETASEFDWRVIGRDYLELYKALLNNGPPDPNISARQKV